MRTADDLRTAFAELADTAPDLEVLSLPEPVPPRSLRRVCAPAAAALVTAAVVGGVFVATLPDDGPGPVAASELRALPYPAVGGPIDTTFRFTADAPRGEKTVRSYSIDQGGQELTFRRPPSGRRCDNTVRTLPRRSGDVAYVDMDCRRVTSVRLYYKGRPAASDTGPFDPDQLVDRVRQDVDGRLGYFARRGSPVVPELADGSSATHLFWQYAPGAWAEALANDKSDALHLARSVRPDERRLTVPVVLAPTTRQYLNTFDAELSSAGGRYNHLSDRAKYGTVDVRWGSEASSTAGGDVSDPRIMTVDGRQWLFHMVNGQPEAVLQDSRLPVTISTLVGDSYAHLRTYVERVRLAPDPGDGSTWLPASELRTPD